MPSQPTKPTLTASDPPGWYECRFAGGAINRRAMWFDGDCLYEFREPFVCMHDPNAYTDFRRLSYAEPTPQPGVAELVEACREGACINGGEDDLTLAETLRLIAHQLPGDRCGSGLAATWADWLEIKAREIEAALAAVEAAQQERKAE